MLMYATPLPNEVDLTLCSVLKYPLKDIAYSTRPHAVRLRKGMLLKGGKLSSVHIRALLRGYIIHF